MINYLCIWSDKKDKSKSWSGTNYSLMKALMTCEQVKDVGITYNKIEKFAIKVFNKINITLSENLTYFLIKQKNKNIDDNPIIQIGDLNEDLKQYYIYQDMSIPSLIYLKKNNSLAFSYTGFDRYTNRQLEKRLEKQMKVYHNSSGIFTMSKWLEKNLKENTNIPKEKIHFVGAGINVPKELIDLNQKKENNKILFVGRDFERKGGKLVLEAFNILKEKYDSNVILYIAGPKSNPNVKSYEGVEFLGDISYSELSKYFNICDIFCMPSYYEAYGIVFAEALIYGLPCIARNDFEMKEFIKDGYNGYLIDSDDIEQLAYKMYQLLHNNTIINNVKKEKEKYIQQYSWNNVANRMIEYIGR